MLTEWAPLQFFVVLLPLAAASPSTTSPPPTRPLPILKTATLPESWIIIKGTPGFRRFSLSSCRRRGRQDSLAKSVVGPVRADVRAAQMDDMIGKNQCFRNVLVWGHLVGTESNQIEFRANRKQFDRF